jgi:uncharacterized protein YjbI with pentapeptide repeats
MRANLQAVPPKRVLTKKVYEKEDFSGQDLRGVDMTHKKFLRCNFDDANMSEVNGEYSDFTGSTFRRTNLYRCNFKDCKLASIVFEPKDAYGITFSFTCQTFQNVQISQLWFYAWMFMLAGMWPIAGPVKEDLKNKVLSFIGAVRYVKLTQMFQRRDY